MASNKIFRRWKLRLLQRIFDYDASPSDTLSPPHSAVIFVARHIGDTIATYPIVRSLQACGTKEIHLILKYPAHDAMVSLVSEGVHLHSITHERDLGDIRRVAHAIRQRSGNPDLLVQAMTRETTASLLLIKALKARTVLGLHDTTMRCYLSREGKSARTLHNTYTSPPECWARLMKDVGLPEVKGRFELPVPDTIDSAVHSALAPFTPYVALNLDGSFARKSLSLTRAIEVANLIQRHFNLSVVVACSPQGEEKALSLAKQCSNVVLPNMPRSLAHSAAIIRHANLLVSPDTSLVHMASAHDVPTLAFYRHNTYGWQPTAPYSEVLIGGDDINDLPLAQIDNALLAMANRLSNTPLPPT